LVINPETMEYTEIDKPKLEILSKFGKDLKENMDIIFNSEDKEGKLLWEMLRSTFYYAAHNVPKATQDYKDIDRAMVWGFNWKKGPFQLWDLMGYERVKERIQEELGDLPDWVADRKEPFYEKGEILEKTTPIQEFVAEDNVPKATQDYKDIDRAMVWGFNWKKGPFQLWDLMGYERVKERIQEELGDLPDWVADRKEPFYEKGEILEKTTPIQEFVAED